MDFIPEEIVVEILLRLAVKPLFIFKCVSKRYNLIISRTMFAQYYIQRAYSCRESWSSSGLFSALLLPLADWYSKNKNTKDLSEANDNIDSVYLYSVSGLIGHPHEILCSSNGLILTVFHPDRWRVRFSLHVTNPLTKQSVQLPKSTMLTQDDYLKYGLATRRDDASALFLTYKVVIVQWVPCRSEYLHTWVEIFSSDTGSWTAYKLNWPVAIGGTCWRTGISHNGILYWLHRGKGIVVTYDPFDNPRKLGSIKLPHGEHHRGNLIFSGDREAVKYCKIEGTEEGEDEEKKCCHPDGAKQGEVDRFTVWGLEERDGDWVLENQFMAKRMHYLSDKYLMLAPNIWNRHLLYVPLLYLRDGYTLVDSRDGTWDTVKVDSEPKQKGMVGILNNPLIFVDLCPWSSPFYCGYPNY